MPETFENDVMVRFLQLNPTVTHLTVEDNAICNIRDSIITSNITLNDLNLNVFRPKDKFYDDLNELHTHGVYKRLHMDNLNGSPSEDQLAALRGLVTLYIRDYVTLPRLDNLKELGFTGDLTDLGNQELNMTAIPNLKRLKFQETSVDAILPFIRHSANLKTIEIGCLKETTQLICNVKS